MDFIQKPLTTRRSLAVVENASRKRARRLCRSTSSSASRDALLVEAPGREAQGLERILPDGSTSRRRRPWNQHQAVEDTRQLMEKHHANTVGRSPEDRARGRAGSAKA